ncbi:MAG TPA: MauE/DoxX family redox-associated membrane protein [Ignavibacteria bacterium]|nr:MauE/DoxX family redox-associated membrane protein [Ignavibacteria bacterium]
MKHTYKIQGMSCNSCVSKIENQLINTTGITSAKVSLNPPQAEISMSEHVDTVKLNLMLSKIGNYSLQEIHTNGTSILTEVLAETESESKFLTYKPIILIFVYLLGLVFLGEFHKGYFSAMTFMNNFMGGFFITFSFFKLLNLEGFANAYSSYDIIAKKWNPYGYIYPFIELFLGIAFLSSFLPFITNSITFIVMAVSSIGVIESVLKKNKIQCACLGTVFNLPMSTVTIIEDLLMVTMSAIMLILI